MFLKNYKCTVYESRPSQCRTWPFWNENMNAKTWNEDISVNCPGIGKGKKISSKLIKKYLKEDYDNEISILNDAYNMIFSGKDIFKDRIKNTKKKFEKIDIVNQLIEFIEADRERPLCQPKLNNE